jgi:beta-lactamase class A
VLLSAAALFPGPCLSGSAAAATPLQPERLTNPLLKYVKFRELRPFMPVIEARIARAVADGEAESAAVYFRSLSEGMWFGIGEKDKFAPASILKVPIMMAYYKMAEKDRPILEKKLKYVRTEPETQTDFAPSPAKSGRSYTVEQLIGFMIANSDNDAGTALISGLPMQNFIDTFHNFGIDVNRITAQDEFVSLKKVASLLRVLYNASYLNEKMSERALGHLLHSTFQEGIRAGVPPEYPVAHKFGIRTDKGGESRQLHEVAIVYYHGNPYLLAVMTKGKAADHSRLAGLIKDISAMIFHEVSIQTVAPASLTEEVVTE